MIVPWGVSRKVGIGSVIALAVIASVVALAISV